MGLNKNYGILTFFSVVKVDVGHSGCSVNHSIGESVSFSESVSQSVGVTSFPCVFLKKEWKFANIYRLLVSVEYIFKIIVLNIRC